MLELEEVGVFAVRGAFLLKKVGGGNKAGIVNLIHRQGLRLADSTHGRTIRGCLGGIWRVKQPCVRPLSFWRPRTVPAAPHGSVLHQGDDGVGKSARESDHVRRENVVRGLLT